MVHHSIHLPISVVPDAIASAVADETYWFIVGGQAVRCFSPYRPTRDVDFGVGTVVDIAKLIGCLRERAAVQLIEESENTTHLKWQGFDICFASAKGLYRRQKTNADRYYWHQSQCDFGSWYAPRFFRSFRDTKSASARYS